MSESSEWNDSENSLSTIKNYPGINLGGGTEPQDFEWASHQNHEFRLGFMRQAEGHERELCWWNWPFEEDGDSSFPSSVG